jgi:hypothetical protein
MQAFIIAFRCPGDCSGNISWMLLHWIAFALGGTTFIAGTTCYFFPDWQQGAAVGAWLYTIGSCGFLTVDVLEFFTFTKDPWLRANIAMSATGSSFYVLGSIGFIPAVADACVWLGIWGFIIGSFFIGVSQLWKATRIGWCKCLHDNDLATQMGVELDAGLGAWCFFFGTLPLAFGSDLTQTILCIWLVGSVFFTLGSLFLGYRHVVEATER